MVYTFNALQLFLQRRISWHTLVFALRTQPIAVCGRGGNEIICPNVRRLLGVEVQ
jgi:hypothetical protein